MSALERARLRAALAQLAQGFLERARAELATAGALLARARAGDREALDSLHDFVHRLHGTGAAVGFGAISQRALALELVCEELGRDAGRPGAARAQLFELFAERLELLGTEIAAAALAT